MSLRSAYCLALLFILQPASVYAGPKVCEKLLVGPRFIHSKYPKLFRSAAVKIAAKKARAEGTPASQPDQKILAWLSGLDRFATKKRDDERASDQIRKWFHRRYVTQPSEISESYFQLQVRVHREQGLGDVELTEPLRKRIAALAVEDQIESLDPWIDYFLSSDGDSYPMWLKYWALMSVVKLAKFDAESRTFNERSRGQAQPFPELNREAFALVVDWMIKKVHGQSLADIQDENVLSQLKNPSFGRLYARALDLSIGEKCDLTVTKGAWVKCPRNSDPKKLVDSLTGMNTGWCTVGISTAKDQLETGDFYVYYSEDNSGAARIPRIAIRMKGPAIAEIRGIDHEQSLDPDIASSPILEQKLKEFGVEGEKFKKKSSDMKTLTRIENKTKAHLALSTDELRFLYEMESPIEGFGYKRDPRIEQIRRARNIKADLALILAIDAKHISLTREEALQPWAIYHYGDLDLSDL